MTALDMALADLESQPWGVRCRFEIRREGGRATIHCGGMQIGVSDLVDGRVEVIYEHALHEVTREQLQPAVAGQLLLALVQRE